jgi:hypothetical protein
MTKKDYNAIADIIASEYMSDETEAIPTIESIAAKLANLFARDNPRFDKGFFLSRCGDRRF